MIFFITFLEGIMTFLSPCLLPMIPIYLGYLAGKDQKQSIVKNALGFILGFTLMFSLLGLASGTIGAFLTRYQRYVHIICGLVMIGFGLYFLGIGRLSFFRGFHLRSTTMSQGFFSAVFFGIVFSIGWTPCVGAFLGSALMLASSTGSTWMGLGLLITYSLGLGVPFLLSAILFKELTQAFNWIKGHYHLLNKWAGALLILVGLTMISGLFNQYFQIINFS
ncbi:Thiol:disulfide interchange protein DsbD precursor [Clostridiales bacterium CHKCI006]|uniref:Cytochrome c biogenesis protein CcdA n=1 Tax=Candidatus Fimiplasma intestinipullorum TaxID=2840825 RepID=A0A9D1HM10_9FIRM|nr:Thiol:disulfide interchange protein DsbD precursor [Clostridiales bacterium CHKCI006]HIU12983.1 cytochrome c biogenesis protein CcdA [Candidatus Fimiplasma intestinipullorum]